jgi:hydroxymethylpyrimidine/phosphomethylpyrimidine kinase
MAPARSSPVPRALTIAGSDSGGGAGIQADLKTFTALGVFGMTALTAVTAQNTLGVRSVEVLSPAMVVAQIDAVAEDIGVDALKTGMLATADIVVAVAEAVRRHRLGPLVVDPVMVAKSGDPLLAPEAREAVRRWLLPLATVVTPNIPEAAALLGVDPQALQGAEARRDAARALHALGPRWVVVKGGHLAGEATDLAFDGTSFLELRRPRLETRSTHGTGCTFSAAIAAYLARGMDVPAALEGAKEFIHWAIAHGLPLGGGHGPTNHFYHLRTGV